MNESCGLVTITDRRKAEFTAIKAVDSFDEYGIVLSVSCGKLSVEGEGLNITVLDLDKGIVCAEGKICAVVYSDSENTNDKGFISRLFGGRK
jgi:sporulation protein YabP